MKKSNIQIEVDLDENNVPNKIEWQASDSPAAEKQECNAFLLSLWDGSAKDQLRINLWNNKMTIEEMNHFFFRTFMGMADTLKQATNNAEDAQRLKDFAVEFGKKNKVLKG